MTAEIKVLELKSDCKEVLQHCVEQSEGFDGVMIIALKKDGTPYLRASLMNGMESAYILQFANAYYANQFQVVDE